MTEATKEPERKAHVEIAVTSCPECGTEWETVVTQRSLRSETKVPIRP